MIAKGLFNQQAINELKSYLEFERRIDREGLLYKNGDTKKDRLYDFRKHKAMQFFGLALSNGTITLDNAVNDQVYLKDSIDNFKKSTKSRSQEQINNIELTLKNANNLLK